MSIELFDLLTFFLFCTLTSCSVASSGEYFDYPKDGYKHVNGQAYSTNFNEIKWDEHSNGDSFDCKIRKLAFEYARKIASRGLKDIFNGLQLYEKCNLMFNNINEKNKDDISFSVKNSQILEIFVDQSSSISSDKDGSFKNPFHSIQMAIDQCSVKRQNSNTVCQITISSGVYFVREPIVINTDNIKLSPHENGKVFITSDVVVKPKWKLYKKTIEVFKGFNPIFEDIKPGQTSENVIFSGVLKNSTQCHKLCEQQSKCTAYVFYGKKNAKFSNHCYLRVDGKWNTVQNSNVISGKKILIYASDLSEYKLKDINSIFINNRRAIRARFPNANPETMGLHTVPTGYVSNAVKWLPPHHTQDALEIHINTPSRPASLFSTYSYGIGGPVNQFDPPESYWGIKNPTGGATSRYHVPSGLQYSKELEINLRAWKKPSTGVIHTFQHYHWGNWMFKLDSRNHTAETLEWTYGGFQEARGSTDGKEWYVENIFEELDVANEWFYDEETKILYYSPNTTEKDLPAKLSIPQSDSLLQIIGTKTHPVRNSVVNRITFLHTAKTFLKSYAVPSGGDWTIHKNASVYLEGTENVIVDNCTFDSPEGNGLMVSKYNRETKISNNLFYRLGDNGIVLIGSAHMMDGSQGEQPRGVKVLHNTIFDNGIWGKQTYPFVQTLSCESFLKGNVFFNGPRAGINFNDGFGGGNVIDNNLLFNFVRETDDHGPINTWDRVPYLTDVLDDEKKVSLSVKENFIHYNFIINNYRSVWPIDHDDGSCYWTDSYNYLVYGGFKNFMGHTKTSMYNTYVYPDREGGKSAPFCLDTRSQGLGTSGYGDVYQQNRCIIGREDIYRLGNCDVSHLKDLIPKLKQNHYFTLLGDLVVHCGSQTWNLTQFQAQGMEVGTMVEKLIEDDQVIKWGKDLFKI